MSSPRDVERGIAAAGGNRFALVSLVRQRAAELSIGAPQRTVTTATHPVQIAMVEVARGRVTIAGSKQRAEPAATPDATITCTECGVVAHLRRRGAVTQGRIPSRCAAHGLSDIWEQL